MTEKEEKVETEEETKLDSSEMTEERRKLKVQREHLVEEGDLKKKEEVQAYKPPIPFSQRLQKSKMEERFSKFLNMLKKIEINITFAEAFTQMLNYAKFMKDILSKKRKFAEEGVVSLIATYSAVIKKSFPLKKQDPSSFTVPCTIRNCELGKTLCDSGASINLMPQSVVKRLSLGELTPAVMTLHVTPLPLPRRREGARHRIRTL